MFFFSFPTFSPVLVVILFLNDGHLDWDEMEFHSSFFFLIYFSFFLPFHLNSLVDNDIEQVFKCLFTIFIFSSENYLFIYVACIYWVVDFSCFIP